MNMIFIYTTILLNIFNNVLNIMDIFKTLGPFYLNFKNYFSKYSYDNFKIKIKGRKEKKIQITRKEK
jgi:hypothetical protein